MFSRNRTRTTRRISGHVQRALRPLRTGFPASYGPRMCGGELKPSRLPNEIVTYSRARTRAFGRSGRVQTTKRLFPIKSPQPPLHTHPDLLLAPLPRENITRHVLCVPFAVKIFAPSLPDDDNDDGDRRVSQEEIRTRYKCREEFHVSETPAVRR